MAIAAAPLPPPAIVSPAPREVSYGRIEGRVPPGTRQVLVRIGGTVLATKDVRRRRFVVAVSLPSRDVTIRVTAVDRLGRRSSTLVGPVYGLPRQAAPAPVRRSWTKKPHTPGKLRARLRVAPASLESS